MGCWNGTDGITGMPIQDKDQVRCLVIASRSEHPFLGGYTYSDDAWYPIGPSLTGLYDDYGCIKEIQESVAADWLTHFLPMTDKMKEEIEGHSREGFTELDEKILAIERAVSFLPDPFNDRCRLCLWMVHESTWKVMQKAKYECWTESPKDRAKSLKATYFNLDGEVPAIDRMKLSIDETKLMRDNSFVAFEWAAQNHRYDEMVDGVEELLQLKWAMGAARRYFTPMAGSGTQNTDWEVHRSLADLVLRQAEDGIRNESPEEEDEDD